MYWTFVAKPARRRLLRVIVLSLVLVALAAGAYALFAPPRRPALLSAEGRCRLGAYRLEDGTLFVVRQREGESLRAVFFDGFGPALYPDDDAGRYVSQATTADGKTPAAVAEFAPCAEGTVRVTLGGEPARTARRTAFEQVTTTFRQAGVELAGRLVLPPGKGRVPVVVLVHGSERDSALDGEGWQFLLPASGIAAFVYDKRGTGRSGGVYTQDFHLLAADAVAAAAEARRLAGPRLGELGFFGGSQGGWIAPLAALEDGADFVIAAYGLAESPLAEDREEVLLGLREAGYYDEATRRKALEVTNATGRVMASHFRSGWKELAAVEARYRDEPWLEAIDGEFSGDFLRYPSWLLRLVGPFFDVGTSWDYDPLPTLAYIEAPHLWVLAGEDHDAPSDTTLVHLRALQALRPNLDVARFPHAHHGILVPERAPDGHVLAWNHAPGYHALIVDWLRTKSLASAAPGIETWEGGNARP